MEGVPGRRTEPARFQRIASLKRLSQEKTDHAHPTGERRPGSTPAGTAFIPPHRLPCPGVGATMSAPACSIRCTCRERYRSPSAADRAGTAATAWTRTWAAPSSLRPGSSCPQPLDPLGSALTSPASQMLISAGSIRAPRASACRCRFGSGDWTGRPTGFCGRPATRFRGLQCGRSTPSDSIRGPGEGRRRDRGDLSESDGRGSWYLPVPTESRGRSLPPSDTRSPARRPAAHRRCGTARSANQRRSRRTSRPER